MQVGYSGNHRFESCPGSLNTCPGIPGNREQTVRPHPVLSITPLVEYGEPRSEAIGYFDC